MKDRGDIVETFYHKCSVMYFLLSQYVIRNIKDVKHGGRHWLDCVYKRVEEIPQMFENLFACLDELKKDVTKGTEKEFARVYSHADKFAAYYQDNAEDIGDDLTQWKYSAFYRSEDLCRWANEHLEGKQ